MHPPIGQLQNLNLKKSIPFTVVICVIQFYVCGLLPKKSIYASDFSVLQFSAELAVTV